MNHSCRPNCKVSYPDGNHVATVIAIHPLAVSYSIRPHARQAGRLHRPAGAGVGVRVLLCTAVRRQDIALALRVRMCAVAERGRAYHY